MRTIRGIFRWIFSWRAVLAVLFVLFFIVPLGAGLALRTWHWVWLSILALMGAELLTWIPHLLASERPVPVAAIPWIVALYGLPAALGAAFGTRIGRRFWRPRTV